MKLVIFIAIFAAVSCEKTTTEPHPLPSPHHPTNDGVEMLSVGRATEQHLLRYKLVTGTTAKLELVMEMEMETTRTDKLPTLILTTRLDIVDVRPTGAATLKTTVVDARMLDRPGATIPVAAVGQMAEQMKGLVHTTTIAPDGSISDSKIDASNASPAFAPQLQQMTQTFDHVAMQLPSVPVGPGASWTTRKQVKQQGLAITTVTTVQLTSIDGDRIGVTSQTTLTAPDQSVDQNGVKVDIKDIGGGGTLKGTIDLSNVTLVGELTSEFRGKMTAAGQQMTTRVVMKLTFTAPDR